jgi:hypothetical protein
VAESLALTRGRDADAARWVGLGQLFGPDFESIAALSSARWSALGDLYQSKIEAGIEASTARWSAAGEWYVAQSVQGE